MNEKIVELYWKCNKVHGDYSDGGTQSLDIEKFAELIILECINQVELTWMNQNGWSRNTACVQSIKDYFEVK